MPTRLAPGIYESLVTSTLRRAMEEARSHGLSLDESPVPGALLHELIVRELRPALEATLKSAKDPVAAANSLAAHLQHDDDVATPPSLLTAVRATPEQLLRTASPLSQSALLTGAAGEPRLGYELEREIATADEVDALVSFVTWEGWFHMKQALENLARRGCRLRLITTTYTGATDAAAVKAIAQLPGAEVHVDYDGRQSRLHAKAWLFRRNSGFHTTWVGSANLSKAALAGGMEWTIKASAVDMPSVVEKFTGTFETLWNDERFEPFRPEDESRLVAAIAGARDGKPQRVGGHFIASLKPYPFQQDILDKLQAEREVHGHHRNLVVAATGTGKTLISAFDYQRRIPDSGIKPRLLFVAHREEILQQARETFGHVVGDLSFGALLGGGEEPRQYDHLFTTVQSFYRRSLHQQFPADHWDHVIVDECHHAKAESYRTVVEELKPRVLVGLTATPERGDGSSLLPDFDGRIAAEVRLWHALERQLLAPFNYYGIADGTDLTNVEWKRGGYTTIGLENVYTGNDRRAELIAKQFREHRGAPRDARALGFCVSVPHAEFMARKFREFGIPAAAVHGDSPEDVRQAVRAQLQRREINVIFTCELYNEGVDLPFVDSLLFLRPTASATVFLQQLGRGLRLAPGKTACLVLDFIGNCRKEFRFDRVLTAVTGVARGKLADAVEAGLPTLPSGCSMKLDEVSRSVVLANVKAALKSNKRILAAELGESARRHGPGVTLEQYLEDAGRPLEDIYEQSSFTQMRLEAGLDSRPLQQDESEVLERLHYLIHVDDGTRLSALEAIAAGGTIGDPKVALMLGYQLWHDLADTFDAATAAKRIAPTERVGQELKAIARVLSENQRVPSPCELPDGWTLSLHARYMRREVLVAVGLSSEGKKRFSNGGVDVAADGQEILYVTLNKDAKHFSPTTRYHDYAISRDLFHWQTQGRTRPDRDVGHDYITGKRKCWLFVQQSKGDPYVFLGPVTYVSHEGSKPMSITWRLQHPMPAALFQDFASLLAA